jgi:hypothetical protein
VVRAALELSRLFITIAGDKIMTYDLEKFREKRERVLGVRKRGLGFGTVAALVAGLIVLGLALVAVPKTVSYFTTRNLDDAIYKLTDATAWEQAIVKKINDLAGVKKTEIDHHDKRLVVTFNRGETGPEKFQVVFNQAAVKVELLNRTGHRERLTILRQEAEFETP